MLKENGDNYIIIAGERRFRAAQMAGLEKVPAIVRNMEEQDIALVAIVENVQREDLNFIEEARAYKKLMEEFGLTQVEIAEKVNKKQSTISNKIRILGLPEYIQVKIMENKLTERHARALLKLPDAAERDKVTDKVIKNNLNVKQTEKLIADILEKREEACRKLNKINYISYKIYLNTIKKTFNQIKEMEKNVKLLQEDKGDYLEVKIILPKNDRCFT
jgi:ParB family chromosome partitioning protein